MPYSRQGPARIDQPRLVAGRRPRARLTPTRAHASTSEPTGPYVADEVLPDLYYEGSRICLDRLEESEL